MSSRDLFPDLEQVVYPFLEDLASPVSLGVYLRYIHGEWDQLVAMTTDPKDYNSALSYFVDAAATSLLRKIEEFPTSYDREAAAEKNFLIAEEQCFRANERLDPYLYSFGNLDGRIVDFFDRARKIVADILGNAPDLFEGRFGPGATYGDKGQRTLVPDKMTSSPTLTSDAIPFLFQWSGTAWASALAARGVGPTFVPGNRFTTVPKDAIKNRGIAIEPSLNVFYQLALGRCIRQRLKIAGIDLDLGQAIHHKLAREGSASGDLATLDLSNASDTVCRNLVRLLLPYRWHALLDMLRSPRTLVKGRWYRLEKFSSMGNGYTFELETLCFLALSQAALECTGHNPVRGRDLSVLGDDIIVPSSGFESVVSALRFCGFTLNEAKTFGRGPFRESCGGDFWEGEDVRPIFLKEKLPREPQEWISFANQLNQLDQRHSRLAGRPYTPSRAWHRCISAVPSDVQKCRGPKDLGDSVIHDCESRWTVKWRHNIRYLRAYLPSRHREVSWVHWFPDVMLATAVYRAGNSVGGSPHSPVGSPSGDQVPERGRDSVMSYTAGWVPFS